MTELSVQINADWNQFSPCTFLDAWHTAITPEITATCRFLIETYQHVAPNAQVIDFCCGPTIYQHVAAAPYVAEIHACDFLASNVQETQRWLDQDTAAFDWTHTISEVLRLEGDAALTADAIAQRAALVRQKLTNLALCDIRLQHPLFEDVGRRYDVVSHCYGADVVADTVAEWEAYIQNCCSVLKPKGRLIMTLIKEAQWWPLDSQILQAVPINEAIVEQALRRIGFDPASIALQTHTVEVAETAGYSDIIFVTATLI